MGENCWVSAKRVKGWKVEWGRGRWKTQWQRRASNFSRQSNNSTKSNHTRTHFSHGQCPFAAMCVCVVCVFVYADFVWLLPELGLHLLLLPLPCRCVVYTNTNKGICQRGVFQGGLGNNNVASHGNAMCKQKHKDKFVTTVGFFFWGWKRYPQKRKSPIYTYVKECMSCDNYAEYPLLAKRK